MPLILFSTGKLSKTYTGVDVIRLLITSFLCLTALSAYAQQLQSQLADESSKFSGWMQFQAETNSEKIGSVRDQSGASLVGMLNYRLSSKNSLRTILQANKDLSGTREQELSGGWIGYIRSGLISTEYLTTIGQVRLLVPTSENDRKNTARRTGVTLAGVNIINLAKMGHTNGSMLWISTLTKNVNEFTVAANGEPNIEFTFNNTLIYGYSFSDKWSVNISGSLLKARNYRGRDLDDTYVLSESINYQITPKLQLSVGHSTSAQIVNNQIGKDQDITIYDRNNAAYYVSAFYLF